METLGVYVQVPFCASKCSFCNFSSGVAPASEYDGYTEALVGEISLLRGSNPSLLGLTADSFYFGGGTPSLLGVQRLREVWRALREVLQYDVNPESTIEITPGSADIGLLRELRAMGFNRLSLGAQSFDDRELARVGRLHSARDTELQVEAARRAGFRNISLDLLAGLPHQTEESWRSSLESAARLAPEHVSVYLFEVDEKSRLGRAVLAEDDRYSARSVPGEDFMAGAYQAAREFLAREGYAQYEISNFSRPGFESHHNRKYWELKPYLGLGAGAHSFDGLSRWSNEIAPSAYSARIAAGTLPVAESRMLNTTEQVEEFFFLGLRKREGVNLPQARARWGEAVLDWWEAKAERLEQEGWMLAAGESLKLSDGALLVSNEVLQEFLR